MFLSFWPRLMVRPQQTSHANLHGSRPTWQFMECRCSSCSHLGRKGPREIIGSRRATRHTRRPQLSGHDHLTSLGRG
jgi:hypothetical protein